MDQELVDVVPPSRLRRRIVRASGNLLILIGALLLGSSIVAATRTRGGWPNDAPLVAAVATATPAATPAAHKQPLATATIQIGAAGATPDQREIERRQSTPRPVADVRPPLPPRPSEGLLEPIETVKQSTSPYAQNVAGLRAIHISVPNVGIDAEVVEVAPLAVQSGQQTVFEWQVADWAAGHHSTSANPGEGGNIVMAGHDDVRGEVFRGLHDVKVGDQVIVSTDNASYTYVVQEVHMRLFTNESLNEQLTIGAFIGPMPEERLTLVTCWPYRVDTHRLIVIAKPAT